MASSRRARVHSNLHDLVHAPLPTAHYPGEKVRVLSRNSRQAMGFGSESPSNQHALFRCVYREGVLLVRVSRGRCPPC